MDDGRAFLALADVGSKFAAWRYANQIGAAKPCTLADAHGDRILMAV